MTDIWWAKVKCPNCNKLLSVQRWGGGDFRLTCSCGFVTYSKHSDGTGTWEEPGTSLHGPQGIQK